MLSPSGKVRSLGAMLSSGSQLDSINGRSGLKFGARGKAGAISASEALVGRKATLTGADAGFDGYFHAPASNPLLHFVAIHR